MTVQVCRNDEYISFNNITWAYLLDSACILGWQPMGTVIDGRPQWGGGYSTNDGQCVLPHDAVGFAKALEAWLDAASEKKLHPKEFDKVIKELIVFAKKDGFFIL
jgi:hypothetical protein